MNVQQFDWRKWIPFIGRKAEPDLKEPIKDKETTKDKETKTKAQEDSEYPELPDTGGTIEDNPIKGL